MTYTRGLWMVALGVLCMLSGGSGAEWTFPSTSAPYGETVSFDSAAQTPTLICDTNEGDGDLCPGEATPELDVLVAHLAVAGCPGSIGLSNEKMMDVDDDGTREYLYAGTAVLPEDIPCGLTSREFRVFDDSGADLAAGGQFTVTPKGMTPNRGGYLYVRMDLVADDTDTLHSFLLSDTAWSRSSIDQGDIGIEEVDGGPPGQLQTCVYGVGNGRVAVSLDSLPVEEKTGTCGSDGHPDSRVPDDIFTHSFYQPAEDLKHPNVGGGVLSFNPFKNWELDSWTPVHDNGEYQPAGQLVRGFEPPSRGGDGPYWYICRDGNDGTVVDTKPDRPGGHDKCRTPSNEWVEAPVCNDGLDNDNDGAIDLDDPGCQGDPTRDSEAFDTVHCDPVITLMNDGTLMANSSRQPEGGECTTGDTEPVPDDWSSDATGVFTCHQTGSYTGLADVQKQDFCNRLDYQAHSYGPELAPAAEYYLSQDYLLRHGGIPTPLRLTGDGGVAGAGTTWNVEYPDGSTVVTDTYGWTAGLQSLHQAEQTYAAGQDPHAVETWRWTDTELQDLSDGYEPGERSESWVVAQPGATNEHVGDPEFPGGFAGRCGPDQNWIHDTNFDDWRCSGAPQWSQAVLIPELTGSSNSKELIGMLVMPYNWKDTADDVPADLTTYKEAWQQFHGETPPSSQTLAEVQTVCYPSESFELTVNQNWAVEQQNAETGVDYFRDTVQIDTERERTRFLSRARSR